MRRRAVSRIHCATRSSIALPSRLAGNFAVFIFTCSGQRHTPGANQPF
jgi:hypothetical protein